MTGNSQAIADSCKEAGTQPDLLREQAQALGFDSVEQMREHQAWLERMGVHRRSLQQAVEVTGSADLIDLREAEWS